VARVRPIWSPSRAWRARRCSCSEASARDRQAARRRIDGAIADGSGLAKLRELVEAQGGDPRMVDDPGRLPRAPHVETLHATSTAYVKRIAADEIGAASVLLGAGRETKGDPIDHRTGIVLHAKVGARVERGAAFAEVPSRRPAGRFARDRAGPRGVRVEHDAGRAAEARARADRIVRARP